MKMKTSSQLKRLDTENQACHKKPARLLASARLTAGVTILLFTLINGEAAVDVSDFCRQTAQDVLTSCRDGAQSDL